jgi:acetyl-CoA acyltransferase
MQDVFVVSATRTAVGKAGRGTLSHFRPDDMAAAVITESVKRSGAPAESVQDVVMGCAFPETVQGMNVARIAALRAGLPDTVSAMTINRFCSSGLEAMSIAAAKIDAGMFDVAVAGGVESMSMVPMGGVRPSPNPTLTKELPSIYIGMGHAGDNVARDFGFNREELDAWAYQSHQRAIAAIQEGDFSDEITPLDVPTGNNGDTKVFDTDEGPRADTSPDVLAGLRVAFSASPKNGFHTAGNSSQTSDGAAACVLMNQKGLDATGAKPLARFLSYNVAAGDPKYLGPAQLEAIPKALEMAGVKKDDIGLFEINEAFAAVVKLVVREMDIDPEKANVNGGAIALGHPLGCTGAKLSATLLNELKRRGEKYGVVTMCIGGGMGAAGVFEMCD